ncbi:MAG TPA: beta-propeller fold lactonase family protein [Candidatus Binatia bacterium]
MGSIRSSLRYGVAVAALALATVQSAGATMSELHFLELEPIGTPWFGAREAVPSPDGAYLYVATTEDFGSGGGVAVYARDASSGLLDPVQLLHTGRAHSIAISPDGAHVYVAVAGGFTILTLARDAETGTVSQISSVAGPEAGTDGNDLLVVSPDGRHVYAAGSGVVWYERDPESGALGFGGRIDDPFPEVPGSELGFASALAISPDGKSLYVTDDDRHSLLVFTLDDVTGEPTAVHGFVQGDDGIDGLTQAANVEVSPDGRNVHVSGLLDDVASFARDPDDGTLTFLGVATGRGGDATTLAIAISPDGGRLYAPSISPPPCCVNELLVFARDPETGELARVESVRAQQAPDSNGLSALSSAVVSPDGRHLYVSVGLLGVAAFRIDPLCAPEPLASCAEQPATAKSALVVHDRPGSDKDSLDWRLQRADVAREALGDPRTDTDLALCVYAAQGDAWRQISQIHVPAGGTCGGKPCWRPLGGADARRGFVRRDPRAEHGGLRELALRVGTGGRGSVVARLKGDTDGVSVPNLPLAADRVVAQLATEGGACWQSTFSAPALASDARRFRDRGD